MQLSGTNGQIEWTSESAYYSLLLELKALPRALLQSQDLKPAKHELLQLNAIRVTALTCSRPFDEFLTKISKFENRVGTFSARNNKLAGFHRIMQGGLLSKDDIKDLSTRICLQGPNTGTGYSWSDAFPERGVYHIF